MGKIKPYTKHIIAAIIITAIIIGAVFYLYGNWEGYNTGYDAGSAGAGYTPRAVDSASLQAELNATTFDFSSTVAADGSVSSDTSLTLTLYLNNTDDDVVAESLYVTLVNPRTEKEGLHNNLETDSFEFAVTEGGTTTKLYRQGDYISSGWFYGDLSAGGGIACTIQCTFKSAVAGTFQDGQTYTCYLYGYQASANDVTTVTFYITT